MTVSRAGGVLVDDLQTRCSIVFSRARQALSSAFDSSSKSHAPDATPGPEGPLEEPVGPVGPPEEPVGLVGHTVGHIVDPSGAQCDRRCAR